MRAEDGASEGGWATGEDRSVGRFLVRGGLWAFLGKFFAIVGAIGSQMLLARLVAPGELGAYFLTQSVVAVAALVGQMGLHRALVRHLAESTGLGKPEEARAFIVAGFLLAAPASGLVAALYGLGLGELIARHVFESPAMLGAVAGTCVWIALQALQALVSETFRGLHRIGPAVLFGGTLTSGLLVVVFGALFFAKASSAFNAVVWISAGATLVNVCVAVLLLQHHIRGHRSSVRRARHMLLPTAVPLAAVSLIEVASGQVDLWVVGATLAEQDVALYGAAKRLAQLVGMPLLILNAALAPLIAELLVQEKLERLQNAIRSVATVALVAALMVGSGFLLAGPFALDLAYGEFYRASAPILIVVSLERLVFVWTGPCGLVLVMSGNERVMLIIAAVSGALMAAGAAGGVAMGGTFGAAVGASMGLVSQNGLMWYYSKRRADLQTHATLSSLPGILRQTARLVFR